MTRYAAAPCANLSVTYSGDDGDVRAVRNVSFTLGRERLGIVGESGSGKSTTGRAIMGLVGQSGRIEADELRLGDTDLRGLSERGFRKLRGQRIAMVLQDPKYSLDPVMSVGQQIAETHRTHLRSTKRDARRAALEMLEAVHIRDPERVYTLYPHQVSGGMGQRVMIAMMLIADPDILIADEPTSALDVTVQTQVLAIIDDLVRDRGMGLILISHNLHLVSSFCDRVLVMYGGQVVETCAAANLSEAQASLHARPARRPAPARQPAGRAAAIAARPRLDGRPRMIVLDDVTIAYGTGARAVVAVRDFTLTVPEGEAVGLVGESGSGKSTVLRAVAGLIPYAAGEITLAGRRVDRRRTTAERKMVQMVFQDPYGSLHPNQTVDQILAMPVAIHRLDRGEARIAQVLAEVGLGSRAPLPLSPPAFRRPAPARGHRPGPDPGTAHPAARRTDQRPGRIGAGGDPQPARPPAPRPRAHHADGQPRSRGHRPSLRTHRRDEPRPVAGDHHRDSHGEQPGDARLHAPAPALQRRLRSQQRLQRRTGRGGRLGKRVARSASLVS